MPTGHETVSGYVTVKYMKSYNEIAIEKTFQDKDIEQKLQEFWEENGNIQKRKKLWEMEIFRNSIYKT